MLYIILLIFLYMEALFMIVVFGISFINIIKKKSIWYHIITTLIVILLIKIINACYWYKYTVDYFFISLILKSIFFGLISIADYALLYLTYRYIKPPILRNLTLIALSSAYVYFSIKTFNELSFFLSHITDSFL